MQHAMCFPLFFDIELKFYKPLVLRRLLISWKQKSEKLYVLHLKNQWMFVYRKQLLHEYFVALNCSNLIDWKVY